MLGKTYENEVCSIARALEVVGERWSLLILRNALFAGSTRYSEFQRSLGVSTNILRDRLDGFVAAGLMYRHRYSDQPEQFEYLLTDAGKGFAPSLIALTAWGDRFAAPDGPPVLYRHADCGSDVHVALACTTCGELDDPASVRAHPGPGMPEDRAEQMRRRLVAFPAAAG